MCIKMEAPNKDKEKWAGVAIRGAGNDRKT